MVPQVADQLLLRAGKVGPRLGLDRALRQKQKQLCQLEPRENRSVLFRRLVQLPEDVFSANSGAEGDSGPKAVDSVQYG